ncbi:MAG: hypothetical protein Q4D21_01040 [Phascolarctobacterium sp.]|nr:hypothetical protein [Phascolarctobacterium sp.]
MRKIIFILMTTIFFLVSANAYADELDLNGYAAIMVREDNSKILYAKHARTDMYPASTTKLFTALLVMENCKNLQDKTKVSWNAIANVPEEHETPYIYCGEEFTIEEFLNIMLVPSGNLIANVMAEYISGSIPKFVELMNKRAKTLGLVHSHWVNPMGWFHEDHYTCAYDMAIIAQEALKHDLIRKIVAKKGYSIPASNVHPYNDRYVNTTNYMMRESSPLYYAPVQGIKTGTGTVAGCNFIGYANKDGKGLFTVLLGSTWKDARFIDTKLMMQYGFNNFYADPGLGYCKAKIGTKAAALSTQDQPSKPRVKPEDLPTYTVSQARAAAEAKAKLEAEQKAKEDAEKTKSEVTQTQENAQNLEAEQNNQADRKKSAEQTNQTNIEEHKKQADQVSQKISYKTYPKKSKKNSKKFKGNL